MNTKRAQLAVETLLIYGIAILIVMLAIGGLVAFGVLDLGNLLPDQCQLGNGIDCEEYLVSTTGSGAEVQFQLRNSVGRNVDITQVSITAVDDSEGLFTCTNFPGNESRRDLPIP